MSVLRALALFVAAMSAFGPAAARAECTPRFTNSALSIVVPDLDLSSGGQSLENFSFRIRNEGGPGDQCSARLRFVRSNTAPSNFVIDYTVLRGARVMDVLANESLPGTAGSDWRTTQISSGPNGANFPFKLAIPSGWGLPAGTWTDDVIALLVDDSGAVVDQLFISITFTVPPSVELRIVGATGENAIARVDMGDLDAGSINDSAPFGVRIWSSSAYTVSFDSQNQGYLRRSPSDDRIPYELYMDGARVGVLGGAAKYVPTHTGPMGNLHPLKVRVRPFQSRAGDYSDRVEVTVTAV